VMLVVALHERERVLHVRIAYTHRTNPGVQQPTGYTLPKSPAGFVPALHYATSRLMSFSMPRLNALCAGHVVRSLCVKYRVRRPARHAECAARKRLGSLREIARVLGNEWLGGRDSNPDRQIQSSPNDVPSQQLQSFRMAQHGELRQNPEDSRKKNKKRKQLLWDLEADTLP